MLRKKILYMDAALVVILFFTVLLMFILSSCKHEPMITPTENLNTDNTGNGGTGGNGGINSSTCDPDTVYFQSQVLPLIVSNCAKSGCHDAATHEEDIVLDSYTNILATGDINAGRADNSDLYRKIIESDPNKRMPPPPAAPLSSTQIGLVYKWIEQGAKNNFCTNDCDTSNVTFSGSILPLLQNSCNGCHSGPVPSGSIDLTTYASVSLVVQNGKLLGSVQQDPGFQPMPRGGNKLPDCQVDKIKIWIENGALNN